MTSVFDFVRKRGPTGLIEEEPEELISETQKKKTSIFDVARKLPSKNKPETSTTQKIASSAPTQVALGTAKKFTWPFDLLKATALGEGLSGIEEIEEIARREGVPFDRQQYLQKVFEAAEALPTQDMAEKFIHEKTGLDLSPQGTVGKIARKSGEFLSLSNPSSLLEGGLKETGKKVGGAAAGATISEGAKELGVPEIISDVIGLGIAGGVGTGKFTPKELKGEPLKARETAEKFNLRPIAGIEKEKPSKIPAVVSPKRQKKVTEELSDSSKKAIEEVISNKIPIKKLRDSGYSMEEAYTKVYSEADALASQIDKSFSEASKQSKKVGQNIKTGIDISPVLNFIKSEIETIKKSAPSLSKPDKVRLKILEDEYKALTKKAPETIPLLDKSGKPLIQTKKSRQPKEINATQSIDQKRNWNENVKDLYRKPEFTGAENEVRTTYAQLGEKLLESIEKTGEKELSESLRFGDKIFSQVQKLNQTEEILGKAFENGYNSKTLDKILGNKRQRSFLKRNLGNEAVMDMKAIANYGKRAEEMVISKLKNPKTIKEYLGELTPLKATLLFFKHSFGGPVAIPYELIKGGIQRGQGLLLTRKGTANAYKNFLKGAATGSNQVFKTASQDLTKAIEKEFGSEEEFLELANKEEAK